MKKALTWIKNNPYKVLQNVWMLLITLLLGFIVIQQRDTQSDVSSMQSDVSSVASDVSSIRREVFPTQKLVCDVQIQQGKLQLAFLSLESVVSSIKSDVSSIDRRLLFR